MTRDNEIVTFAAILLIVIVNFFCTLFLLLISFVLCFC